MKTGLSIQELAAEIARQAEAKRDFVVNSKNVQMEAASKGDYLRFGPNVVGILPTAHRQLAEFTGIPQKYYDRMKAEQPELLARNVNDWLKAEGGDRMIRVLDNKARAFLSNKYRCYDNVDLAEAALPKLLKLGVDVISCAVTDTKLYIKAVDKRINADIPVKGHKMGDGSHVIFDTVSPAIVISNSEVGAGALSIQTSIWTKACTNLAIFAERSIRKTHVGAKHDMADGYAHLLSDETRKLTDQATWAQVSDVVEGAFNEARFHEIADKLQDAAKDPIGDDVVKVVELVGKRFGATEGERGSILSRLIEGGDLSRYGLSAAVTRASADFADYDRATEFERVGGQIIEAEWSELKKAA